ncbi:hypothetical protein ACQKWADRAFT_296180 [Trichoderma austrokoningii]
MQSYHMSLQAQFCYSCGREWKHCSCPFWVERRLFDEERVNDAAGGCSHRGWLSLNGSFRCETCQDYLRGFLLWCVECGMRMCRRCKDRL